MDLWMVAAAAGVGYAAKANYLKNSTSRITESSLYTCSCEVHAHSYPQNILQQIRDRTCPLCRLAAIKRAASSSNVTSHGEVRFKNYEFRKRNDFEDSPIETLPELLLEESGSSQKLPSSQLKNSSHGYILKPLKLLDSNLTAELYRKESRLEEYASILLPSPSTYMERTLTIGNLITRGSHDFREEMETKETQAKPFSLSGFSNNDLLVFLVGIATGMMLIIAYNRKEVERLNQLLKKNEDLVHDLQEELEMKNHSILKELRVSAQSLNGTPTEISKRQEKLKKSTESDCEELCENKANISEAMSKLEAELEAELEMLEQTVKASSSLGRNSDFVEENLSDSGVETSESSSDHMETGIYTVSPHELSLRLHQVIQERLHAQIMELEAALEITQKRLHALESDISCNH